MNGLKTAQRTGGAVRVVRRIGARNRKNGSAARSERYTTKIIKAGALLSDTRTFLSQWDSGQSVRDNLRRFREENIFGKASRSRVEDILAIFRQRYLREEEVTKALVVLVQERFPTAALDRILYFHAAKADPAPRCRNGDPAASQRQGITDSTCSTSRVNCRSGWRRKDEQPVGPSRRLVGGPGLLSTLRDFGVLQGIVNKQIAPAYLSTEAFAYIIFYLKQHQPSGAKLPDLPDWKLFFPAARGCRAVPLRGSSEGLLEYTRRAL